MVTTLFKKDIKNYFLLEQNTMGNFVIMYSKAMSCRCHKRSIADYLITIESILVDDIIGNSHPPNLQRLTPSTFHLVDGRIVYLKIRSGQNI
jgi:hypothetical protein